MDGPVWARVYFAFWLAVLGAVLGSFLDCAADRAARGESPLRGRSHCPFCGCTLTARDLVPVFSFLAARGRCRHCGEKIPAQCLVAELVGGAAFVGLGLKFGLTPELVMWLILACILLLVALLDWNTRLIPNKLLLAAGVCRMVFFVLLRQPVKETILSMAASTLRITIPLLALVLAMDQLLGRETMGGGDIKLLFVLGLYLDCMQQFLLLLTACLLGLAAGIWRMKRGKGSAIPFGPFLALGWLLVLLFGDPVLAWYRALLV